MAHKTKNTGKPHRIATAKMPKPHAAKFALMVAVAAGVMAMFPPAKSYADLNKIHNAPNSELSATTSVAGLLTKISLREGLQDGKVNNVAFYDDAAMKSFYKALDNGTFWVSKDGLSARGKTVLGMLQNSWTHGLNPADYHVAELEKLSDVGALANKARIELLMTDAVVRFSRDLSGMRMNAESLNQEAKDWQAQDSAENILSGLERQKTAQDVQNYINGFAPHNALYQRMRDELVKLSKQKDTYGSLLPLDFGEGLFRPGDRSAAVQGLRARLGIKYNPQTGPQNFYDDDLASAVIALQQEHGLDADGIIGPQTLDILNNGRDEQMKQLVVNLERMRWLDRKQPARYLLVNIASQTLWGIDHGNVAVQMPVVVGSPWRKTQTFKTEVTGVKFNPDWTVPLSIKSQEFLPKLRKEGPAYLDEKNIEVIRGYGKNAVTLDPHSIDWDKMTWRDMSKLRMVQVPGENNALGRIRIMMPNKYNIYLHDTNHRDLFSRSQRLLSHGCVRLSDPEAVARFVLKGNRDWSEHKMRDILDTTDLTEVDATHKMPVYIVYQTVWLDSNGKLVYGADVYNRDKKLLDEMTQKQAYAFPRGSAGEMRTASAESATKLASSTIKQ